MSYGEGVRLEINEVKENKKQYLPLLLLADEQEYDEPPVS